MFADFVRAYRRWSERNNDIAALPWLIVVVVAVMTIATRGRFVRPVNLSNLLTQMPELGLLALAMMVAMITAGINLSIISSANLSAVVMALFLTRVVPAETTGLVMWMMVGVAVVVGLATSAALGAVNGYLIGYVEVPAVLTTLGTMILYEGVTLSITRGFVISGLPSQFLVLGNLSVIGIPIQMWIFAVVAVLVAVLLRRRPYGVHLYFVGSNPTATAFSGVDVRAVLMRTYILSGVLAGVAAIVMLARFNSANARQGSSLLLSTVLICMLGGTDPFGGFGKVSGLVMALVILQMATSGLNLLGVRSFATVALWGVMLTGVIAYRFVQRRRSEQREKRRHETYV